MNQLFGLQHRRRTDPMISLEGLRQSRQRHRRSCHRADIRRPQVRDFEETLARC